MWKTAGLETVFLALGCAAAAPILMVAYLGRNTVLVGLGLAALDPKYFDNEVVSVFLGSASLVFSLSLLGLGVGIGRYFGAPAWRWPGAVLLFILPAILAYWRPWLVLN